MAFRHPGESSGPEILPSNPSWLSQGYDKALSWRTEDLPHGGGGYLHAQCQFTVHAPTAPLRTFAYRQENQGADRVHGTRPPPAPESLGASSGGQIAVPAQHGVRLRDRTQVCEYVPGQMVLQSRDQGPITRDGPYFVRTEFSQPAALRNPRPTPGRDSGRRG